MNFDFMWSVFSSASEQHLKSMSITESNFPWLSERVYVFFLSSYNRTSHMQSLTQSQTVYTHALPSWLLGETTPVGVLCFRNDSKDSLKTAERRAEWEYGKCKKIVNEICQFEVSSQILKDNRTPTGVKYLHLMCLFFNFLGPRKVQVSAFFN